MMDFLVPIIQRNIGDSRDEKDCKCHADFYSRIACFRLVNEVVTPEEISPHTVVDFFPYFSYLCQSYTLRYPVSIRY